MRKPTPPGRQEQIRAERALQAFQLEHERLDELERGGFIHGWRAGDNGAPLEEVLAEFDRAHPQAGKVMVAACYGHCGGYAAFLREEPDYERLRESIRSGEVDALLDGPSGPLKKRASRVARRGLFETLIAFFERYG